MGMGLTIAAGLTHIVLDLLFIPVLGMGISGAAYASVISMMVAGLPPLVMFAGKKQRLHFARLSGQTQIAGSFGELVRELGFAMCNGSSEMVTNLATAVTTMLFNLQMMHLAGEKGVAAISAVLYVESLFIGVFLGFSAGAAPLFSYHFGSGNRKKLARLMQISVTVIGVSSLVMFGSAQLLARPIIAAFAGGDSGLLSMALHGLRIFSFSYLLGGVSIFASALFTALNNGGISALISLVRTLVMRCGLLILLPALLGIDGVCWRYLLPKFSRHCWLPVCSLVSAAATATGRGAPKGRSTPESRCIPNRRCMPNCLHSGCTLAQATMAGSFGCDRRNTES